MNKYYIYLLLFIFVFVGCSSPTENSKNNSVETKDKKIEKNDFFKIGDTILVSNGNKKQMTLKINRVYFTNDRNEFVTDKPKKVFIIEYEYTNLALEEGLLISDFNFTVYDNNNLALNPYPVIIESYGKDVGVGRSSKAKIGYALNTESNKIEIEFKLGLFDTKPSAIVKLNIK